MAFLHIAHRMAVPLRDTGRAWTAFALTPLVGLIVFAIGAALLGDPNYPAPVHGLSSAVRGVLIGGVVEIIPALGAFWAGREIWRGNQIGRAPFIANVALGVLLVLK